MNTVQTNRVNMFKTTIAVMDENHTIWSSMAPLAIAFGAFKNKVAAIDTAAQQQETPSGAAQAKTDARDDLEDVVFLMCEALGALGHSTNDRDLTALTDINRSSLDKLDAEALSNRATTILAEANARATALTPYQVTPANITELTDALQAFNDLKAGPRQAMSARIAQTGSLPTLIREANDILRNQMDRLMNLFSRTHPQFVSRYRAARVIVDRPATQSAPKQTPPPPASQPTT